MKALKIGYISLFFYLVLEGLFPVVSSVVMKDLGLLWLVAITTGISLLFGTIVVINKRLYTQYYNKKILLPTILSVLGLGFGGLLYFFGIKYLNASMAAVLLLLQIPISFLLFNIFGKEPYKYQQVIGSLLMFMGGFFIIYKGGNLLDIGSLIMIIACVLFVLGNYFTKKASLLGANPFFLLLNRNILLFTITTFGAFFLYGIPDTGIIYNNIYNILIIGFLVLFIAKVLWITALKNLNSIIPLSSFPFIAVFTILFSYIVLGEILSFQQFLGLIPITIGFFLLTYFKVS